MSSVDLQSVIAQPPAAVYGALCDPARRAELDPTVTEMLSPAHEIAEGTTFSGAGTLTGEDVAFEAVVIALEPERLVDLGFSYGNGARLHERWRLSPTPSGTLVNHHAD